METLKLNPNNFICVWLGRPKIKGGNMGKDSQRGLGDKICERVFQSLKTPSMELDFYVITGFVCIVFKENLHVVLSLQ